MGGGNSVRVVVADANVIINFIHLGGLNILGSLPNYQFLVPDHVEIVCNNDPSQ